MRISYNPRNRGASLIPVITVDPFYASSYSATSLGSLPGLPTRYGGLTFIDNDTVLIGGAANGASGRLYTIDVSRSADNHVNGFVGTATLYDGSATGIGDFNDGGGVFGPGGVLFVYRALAGQRTRTDQAR